MEILILRLRGGWTNCPIDEYPKYIKDKIKNISKDCFGWDMFGEVQR